MTALDVRYGRTRNARRRSIAIGVVVGVVIAAVLALWVVWSDVADMSQLTESRTITRETLSDHELEIVFQVTAPTQDRVDCAVVAVNDLETPVGWKIVPVTLGEEHTQVTSTVMQTSERPSNAMVYRCWIP